MLVLKQFLKYFNTFFTDYINCHVIQPLSYAPSVEVGYLVKTNAIEILVFPTLIFSCGFGTWVEWLTAPHEIVHADIVCSFCKVDQLE